MSRPTSPVKQIIVLSALLSAAMLVTGIAMGFWLADDRGTPTEPLILNASAAGSGEKVSLATGKIDDNFEALFILDHLGGNLQCWILNARTNKVGGIYRTNVLAALGNAKAGKDLDLVMTTGDFSFSSRGALKPAQCICYVAEGNSGTAAGFSFTYDRSEVQRGKVIAGELQVICKGSIRDLKTR